MDQSPLTGTSSEDAPQDNPPLSYFPAATAGDFGGGPLVVVARTPLEFCNWLRHSPESVQWIEADGLLGEPEVWATAARKEGDVALDVIVSDPASEFPQLYRLADVRNVRDVRVSVPVLPGFSKALRLAASLGIPVRLLPRQPDESLVEELLAAVEFYLHDPMVEAPVDFFHSFLAIMQGEPAIDLWMILEQDPNEFPRHDKDGVPLSPDGVTTPLLPNFVEEHTKALARSGSECENCRWNELCRGYFKLPDPGYSCKGIIKVFEALKNASDQMTTDLTASK